MDVNSSISLLSNIHSITADFLTERLKTKGFPDFASSHGNILFQLSVNEKMTMGELSEKINRDKSTTTVLVRKLESEGFITGEPECHYSLCTFARYEFISTVRFTQEFDRLYNLRTRLLYLGRILLKLSQESLVMLWCFR